jgi:hypothetical protein
MHTKILSIALAGTALLFSQGVFAVEKDTRWYASAMIGAIDTDTKRGAEDDFSGYHFGFGRYLGNGWAAVEANVVGANFEKSGKTVAKQWGIGVDFLAQFLADEHFQPYAVVGAGYLVTDKKLGLQDEDSGMVNLGIGVKGSFMWGMELRTDFRIRRDYGGPGYLDDYIWNIGVNIPLSFRRVDTRSFDEDAAGGARAGGEPDYRFVPDTDSDGFVDPIDRCPRTPGGETVNEFGCSASDDADGDNVPDGEDMCGDTPAGQTVDKHGCRVTPPAELSVPTDPGTR